MHMNLIRMNEYLIKKVLEDENALAELLFQRLSPMLVLRVLPLEAFNYSNCKELYDGLLSESNPGLLAYPFILQSFFCCKYPRF